jgi:hypothetical protein
MKLARWPSRRPWRYLMTLLGLAAVTGTGAAAELNPAVKEK